MMKNLMRKAYVRFDGALHNALHNERGAQAIEWIALAGVVLAVFGAISVYFKGNTEVGTAVSGTLSDIIGKIGDAISGN